jgi:hypothetical protein
MTRLEVGQRYVVVLEIEEGRAFTHSTCRMGKQFCIGSNRFAAAGFAHRSEARSLLEHSRLSCCTHALQLDRHSRVPTPAMATVANSA